MRRALALAAALGGLAGAACAPSLSDLAQFLDTPFGELSAEVVSLDDAEVGQVMDTLMLRFRSYLALREHLPFDLLASGRCVDDLEEGGGALAFVADIPCALGDLYSPATGTVALRQEQVATEPPVVRLDAEYRDVVLGDFTVSGQEHIDETSATEGASVRTLALVQGGLDFDYTFRVGFLDGDVPVFDYSVPAPGGAVLARVTNPSTVGGFVSVVLTGLDGQLSCEVRDAAWEPGEAARGICCPLADVLEGGACASELRVFGLPDGH